MTTRLTRDKALKRLVTIAGTDWILTIEANGIRFRIPRARSDSGILPWGSALVRGVQLKVDQDQREKLERRGAR